MSERGFQWPALDDLIRGNKPVCYGVLKPGVEDPHGIPLVRIVDIESSELRSDGLFRITPALDKEFGRSRIDAGDLLLSIQGTVGRVAIVPPELAGSNISRTIARLSFAAAGDASFYKHWFLSNGGLRAIEGAIVGTTRSSLNIGVLRRVAVPSPDSPEKAKITEVFDTLDATIHQTEAIIEKLKLVKQGLLSDVLTRGIDDNGELRSPQSEAPHLYKQSPLGWTPSKWAVQPLGHVVADSYRYPSYFGIDYVESGVAEVRGELINPDGTFDGRAEHYRYISKATAARFPRVFLQPGDLVMSVRGTIGKFALVPPWLKGAVITANLLKITPARSVVRADWLLRLLLSSHFQTPLNAACSSTTIKTIQIPELMAIPVALPNLEEQDVAIQRLAALDEVRASELMALEKLRLLRAGLMDDLLTGSVRVTPLLA